MPKAEQMIGEGVQPFLEAGEQFLAGAVVAPRGHTQSVAGARGLGQKQTGRVVEAAEEAGIKLESPMALALTSRRLLVLKIANPAGMGIGGKVKDLLSAVPVGEVDSIQAKRLLLGSTLTLTVRGVEIKFEAGAGARTKDLAKEFEGLKAG